MPTLMPVPKARFFTKAGLPLIGGKVQFYETNTTTPKNTAKDSAGTLNTNPVNLDGNGEADIWLLDGLYTVVLMDSANVVQWTVDDVSTLGSGALVVESVNNIADLRALAGGVSTFVQVFGYYNPPNTTVSGWTQHADAGGGVFYWKSSSSDADDGGVVIIPNVSGGNGRWVRIFDGRVSVNDFGARGNYILDNGALNGSASDNTTEINAALSYARTNELSAKFSAGGYLVSGAIDCAVSMEGEGKPRINGQFDYGDASWSTVNNMEGSIIIWDKSTLTTNDIYLRNESGDLSSGVKFKNIGFMSKSTGAAGGGTFLVASEDQTVLTNYNFGNLPPFENVIVCNFKRGLNVETYSSLTIDDMEWRGCQNANFVGLVTTDLAKQIIFNSCIYKNCGDVNTNFIKLENVDSVSHNECFFDVTSEIGIRLLNGAGLIQSGCHYQNQKNGSGPGGNSYAFILSTNQGSATTENVALHKCQGGTDAGDIDLSASPTTPKLTIIDSQLKLETNGTNIIMGTGQTVEIGFVTYGTYSGTGNHNKFNSDAVEMMGFQILDDTGTHRIALLTTDNDERITISPSDMSNTTDAARILLRANDDAAGQADLELDAGIGSNPGDIKLNAATGKQVQILSTDDATTKTTGALNSSGGIGAEKNIYAGGNLVTDLSLKVPTLGQTIEMKEGANAAIGTATLSSNAVTISTTAVKTNSLIFLSYHILSGAGPTTALNLDSIIDGVSFTVKGNTNGTFNWWIIQSI